MIRSLRLEWPGPSAETRTTRLLAVSDRPDPALEYQANRDQLGRVDLVVGCGDLEPDYLGMLGDAFCVPIAFVRGNHDAGLGWSEGRHRLPDALADGRVEHHGGLALAGLSWPSWERGRASRDDAAAWFQVLRLGMFRAGRASSEVIVVSHVPPLGAGDDPSDPFHSGFAAYRWLAQRLKPRLWLHGHTTTATVNDWRDRLGSTTLVNVTGAVLIELASSSTELIADRPAVARR